MTSCGCYKDLVNGDGWSKLYEYCNNNASVRADSFLTCSAPSGIKRSRDAIWAFLQLL